MSAGPPDVGSRWPSSRAGRFPTSRLGELPTAKTRPPYRQPFRRRPIFRVSRKWGGGVESDGHDFKADRPQARQRLAGAAHDPHLPCVGGTTGRTRAKSHGTCAGAPGAAGSTSSSPYRDCFDRGYGCAPRADLGGGAVTALRVSLSFPARKQLPHPGSGNGGACG